MNLIPRLMKMYRNHLFSSPWFVVPAIFALATFVLGGTFGFADDWPQILGPHRNGVGEAVELDLPWKGEKPREVWNRRVGAGYAGVAIQNNAVVVFHRVDDRVLVESLRLDNGKLNWKTEFPATYRARINPDTGPRCVPVIAQDQVLAFDASGILYCLDFATGKQRWTNDLYSTYSADDGYFGAGSSPIVMGDRVLVNCGGREGKRIVALSLKTGKLIWSATEEKASYSSPTAMTIGGSEYAIFVTRMELMAVNPVDGSVAFRLPFGNRGPTVNAATPLVIGNQLFVSSSYRVGAKMLDLKTISPNEIWANDDSLSSQYSTAVYHEKHLWGTHGREDIGRASLRCVEADTGRVKWSEEDFGVAHIILSGDYLIVWTIEGELILVKASTDKYLEVARARVFDRSSRAIPAFADGKLLVRSHDEGQGGILSCLQLAVEK